MAIGNGLDDLEHAAQAPLLQASERREDGVPPPGAQSSSEAQDDNFLACVVILSKTIVGAGVAALPLCYALLGWPAATLGLFLTAWLTQVSIKIMMRGSSLSGKWTYPELTRTMLGPWGAAALDLSVIVRCFGLLLVYAVISSDMLVGKPGYPGVLCGPLGGVPGLGWTCSRPIMLALVHVFIFLPLCSARKIESTSGASWLGLIATGIWATATIVLVVAAGLKGALRPLYLLPDWSLLGADPISIATNIIAIVPILATAFTNQMQVHFVANDLRPFTLERMNKASAAALCLTTCLYLLIAVGSSTVFGVDVQADVLENLTVPSLSPLVGQQAAVAIYYIVRLSFLSSVVTIYPLQMWPLRDSLSKVLRGTDHEPTPTEFYNLTLACLVGSLLAAMTAGSIWGPLQLTGATAGAFIAFVIPGLLAFLVKGALQRSDDPPPSPSEAPGIRSWALSSVFGWALLGLGLLQAATGVASYYIPHGP